MASDVKGKYFMTTNNIQKRFSSLASCLQLQWQIQGLGREGKEDLKFDSGDKFLSCFYLRALTCQELIYFKMSEFRTPPIEQLYKSCCQQNFDFRKIVKILTGLIMGGGCLLLNLPQSLNIYQSPPQSSSFLSKQHLCWRMIQSYTY